MVGRASCRAALRPGGPGVALRHRGAVADLSDLDKEENVHERAEVELLEVYAGTFDADGQALVFETYFTTAEMRASQWVILAPSSRWASVACSSSMRP